MSVDDLYDLIIAARQGKEKFDAWIVVELAQELLKLKGEEI